MLEDDLRNFPMAPIGYLQKIRAAQHYRDITAADELFKIIVRSKQAARIIFSTTNHMVVFVEVEWLDCRLTLVVRALTRRQRSELESAALDYGIVTINSGNPATPGHSPNRSTLIRLIRRLRNLPDFDCGRLYDVCIHTCGSFLVFTCVTGIS